MTATSESGEKQHVHVLTRRKTLLEGLVSSTEVKPDRKHWLLAEVSALSWVLEVLEERWLGAGVEDQLRAQVGVTRAALMRCRDSVGGMGICFECRQPAAHLVECTIGVALAATAEAGRAHEEAVRADERRLLNLGLTVALGLPTSAVHPTLQQAIADHDAKVTAAALDAFTVWLLKTHGLLIDESLLAAVRGGA